MLGCEENDYFCGAINKNDLFHGVPTHSFATPFTSQHSSNKSIDRAFTVFTQYQASYIEINENLQINSVFNDIL